MTHTIQSVIPMTDHILGVKFTEGAIKLYDIKPLFDKHPKFSMLMNNTDLYAQVSADVDGYGISWNDSGWPEWNNGELVTIEIEMDGELLRQVEEVLKPYGLSPEDWAVMALELLVFPPTQERAIMLLNKSLSQNII